MSQAPSISQPAGTDSHLPPVPSAPRRALSCAVLRFFHQDRLAAQLNYIAAGYAAPAAPVDVRPPQAAGLAPPHARGEDQLEIDLVFQALAFQRCDKLCTVSSSATGRSCGAPFFLYARHAGLCVIYPASTASDRIPHRQEWMPSTVFFSQKSACLPVLFGAHHRNPVKHPCSNPPARNASACYSGPRALRECA